ncbi:MAG: benzoate-CoA ligase family protein [Acetobacteraceae bacterium]|nr:benzoate-CoA ligase family protein [Acetobacteraceae bacterium]MDW8399127.1 benzoate-CoA ligase family protein [Acetobacteraceae bacterium]
MSGNAVRWFLDRHVEESRGDRTAFTDPWRSLTYAGLQEASARAAGALAAAGITPERRVVLWLLDTVDFPALFWGAIRLGAVPVPVNTLLTAAQLADLLRDSAAEALVVSAPLLPSALEAAAGARRLRALFSAAPEGAPQAGLPAGVRDWAAALAAAEPHRHAEEASPDQVAFWLYSSGSTGIPKGVKHVHAALRATAETYGARVLGIREDDVCFSAAKLFFAYGLGNALTFPMSVGARSVLLPDRPTPQAVLEVMARHRPTIFYAVPTLYAALLAAGVGRGAGSDRLRRCVSAGEALPEALGRRWAEEVGVDILDGIGSTEMLHIFLSNRPGMVRYGTSGVPVPGYEAKIVDAEGDPVPDGEPGELWVRGPSAAEGYWNRRERSRLTFRGEWTATGDTYIRDPEGFFVYQGRNDDMFKVSGIWVSPFEVEAALVAHPAVLEAAVVARRDADGLVKPMAFVVPRDPSRPLDAAALQAHVKAIAGPWKYPRWIEAVEELPKTPTGKIQRFRLRERLTEAERAA